MPPLSVMQPSFAGGEYSPSLYSRVDYERYAIGLRTCRNFIIHPHGGASNRPGMKYVADAKNSDKVCRVVSFVFSSTEAYVLEFGDYYIRFFRDQAKVQADQPLTWNAGTAYVVDDYCTYGDSTTFYLCIADNTNKQPDTETDYWTQQDEYEIYSPYAEEDLVSLRFERSADVIYITHPDYQTRTLTRYGNADWEIDLYEPEDGPFMPDNVEDTTLTPTDVSGNVTITSSAELFSDLHVGALFKLRHFIEGQTVSDAFTGTGYSSSIKCFTTWRLITHGTWTGKFDIELSDDGGSSWSTLRSFSSADDFNANTYGTEDVAIYTEPFLIRIGVSSFTSGTLNLDLTSDPFFQEGIVQVTTVNTAYTADVDVLQEIGLAVATDDWAEGSWSDYRGWPQVARFFQDRLCFCGTYSEPMTTWMTQIGNYTSFIRHDPLLDDDAISVNLPSRQLNAVNGLVAFKKLIAFTSSSEWTIGAVSGSALTPKTIEQYVEGYHGSYGLDPAVVGNECIYIQTNSKVVRSLQYQLAYDGFVGEDLNILAKHLFDKYTLIDIDYQQDPDSIVWCLRSDGVLLGMTYLPEQKVAAWHWHDTLGTIESICVIPGDGYDELWLAVERENGRFIEYMTQRDITESCEDEDQVKIENQFYVDSGVTFNSPVDITSIGTNGDDEIVVDADLTVSNLDTVLISCSGDLNGKYKVSTDYGAYTRLLLHCEDYTDSSMYEVAITNSGTTNENGGKFYECISLNHATPTYIYTAAGVILTAPLADRYEWTLDFWIKIDTWHAPGGGDYATWIFTHGYSNMGWGLLLTEYGGNKVLELYCKNVTFDIFRVRFKLNAFSASTWYHFAVVKDGSSSWDNWKAFQDGVSMTKVFTDGDYSVAWGGSLDVFRIGCAWDTSVFANSGIDGYLDEFRVVMGKAVWTSDFNVPTSPHTADIFTLLHYANETPLAYSDYADIIEGGKIQKAQTDFSGLDHLEGQTVSILADGWVHDQQVVTGGEITLTQNAAVVHVGLPYYSDLETLNVEVGLRDGTAQGRKAKIGNVTFRLVDTRGGWIGPDSDNLYEAITEEVTGEGDFNLGIPPPMYSGDLRFVLGAGYEDGGRIFYRQVDPLPVTISAVIPEITYGGPAG